MLKPFWMIAAASLIAATATSISFADKTASNVRGELHYDAWVPESIGAETGVTLAAHYAAKVLPLPPVAKVEFVDPHSQANDLNYGAALELTFKVSDSSESEVSQNATPTVTTGRKLTLYFSGKGGLAALFGESPENNLGRTRALKFKRYLEQGAGKYLFVINDHEEQSIDSGADSVVNYQELAATLYWDAESVKMKNRESGKLFDLIAFIDNNL